MIVPLNQEYIHAWISLYREFYRNLPWSPITDEKQVSSLINKTGETESWIAFTGKKIAAIGTLTVSNDRREGILQNFAFDLGSITTALELLKYLVSRAREKNLDEVTMWTWKDLGHMQDIVRDAGFRTGNRMALMYLNPANFKRPNREPNFTIKSLADEISIDNFVESNRIAFADDNTRPLEKVELEQWLESSPGFRADLQLVSIENDRIVGTVMSEYEDVKTEDSMFRRAWIYGLGVVPDARRRGVATHLLMELSRRLSTYKVHDIWVLTDIEGPIRSFYETAGFVHQTDWIEFVNNLNLK